MASSVRENPQVSVVIIRGRLSPDYQGHYHQDYQGGNALTRRLSALSPRSHQDSHSIITTTRVFRHGVNEKPVDNNLMEPLGTNQLPGITPWLSTIERSKPMSTIKSYVLFPAWGSFSTKTDDYGGTRFIVAATSIRQAYAVAHQRVWIDHNDDRPVGIISIYRRATGLTLWCGCAGHEVACGQIRHGDGIRAIRKAIEVHHCPNRLASLRDRLQAAAAATEQEA